MTDTLQAFAKSAESYFGYTQKPWGKLFYRTAWHQIGDYMPGTPQDILDIGCGFGITSRYLAGQGHHVTGIEPTTALLRMAEERFGSKGQQPVLLPIGLEELSAHVSPPFDWIVCHNILEYLDDPLQSLESMSAYTKPGGFLSLITHNPVAKVMKKAIINKDPGEARKGIGSHSEFSATVQTDLTTFDEATLREWLSSCGYTVIGKYGIHNLYGYIADNEIKHGAEWHEHMEQLEFEVSKMSPYRDIAVFSHIIAQKIQGLE